MTKLQKETLAKMFPGKGTRAVVGVHNYAHWKKYYPDLVDLIDKQVVEFAMAFGMKFSDFDSDLVEHSSPQVKVFRFDNLDARNAWLREKYGSSQMYDIRPTQLISDDFRELKEFENELKSIEGYYSEYQRYGNVSLEDWETRLEPYLFGIDIRTSFANYIHSEFMSYNHGTWVNLIKARAIVKAIKKVYAKMRVVKIETIPFEI